MIKYFDFQLSPQQLLIFNALKFFIKDDVQDVFILKGFAGTGKTTILKGVAEWLTENRILFSLLASTGRAAKILRDKTGSKVITIHSEIYVFHDVDDDLETTSNQQDKIDVDDKGQINLIFELRPIISKKQKIYIIDESSMIGDKLDKGNSFAKFGSGKLLQDLFKYDENAKFIFVGDFAQLPPVGDSFSPALSENYIKNKYDLSVISHSLTEIRRQESSSGIIKSSLMIRKLFKRNPMVKFASFPLKGHSDIILHNSHLNLINMYVQNIKEKGFEKSTLICQTNRQCLDINTNVRKALGRKSDKIQVDDILLITQNNPLTGLVNGDLTKVVRVGNREYRCGLSFLNIELISFLTEDHHATQIVEDVIYSNFTNLTKQQHKHLMIDYYRRMKDNGINQKDRVFKDGMLKDPYLNSLRAVYGYAITCHKSQGGEWDEVFLYLDNKIHGIPKPQIYQWLYTAVTRAKTKLHVADDWFIR